MDLLRSSLVPVVFIICCTALIWCVGLPQAHGGMLKGVGGLEALPGEDLLGENILMNPGFESGVEGWSYVGPCFSIDTTVSHSGKNSLRFDAGSGCTYVRQLDLRPGATSYTISGWIKTEGVNEEGSPMLYIFDLTHKTMARGSLKGGGGSSDWRFFELKNVDVSPHHKNDRVEFRIVPRGVKTGTVWFDDLELRPQYKPLRVFVKYPNFRGYLWTDRKQAVDGVAEITPPPGMGYADLVLDLRLKDALTGVEVDRLNINGLKKEVQFSFDTSGLGTGEYLLTSSLVTVDGSTVDRYPDYRIVKAGAEQRASLNVWIDENNVLHYNGKPRFVWGVYDRISARYRCTEGCLFCNQYDYETRIKGFDGLGLIDTYADAGVNTVLNFVQFSGANPGVGGRCDQIGPYIAALDKRGIMHIQTVNNYYGDGGNCYPSNRYRPWWASSMGDEELWSTIATSIAGPGLLGYYTADEPGVASPVTLCGVFRQYQILKAKNPGSVTFEVFMNPAHPRRWFDTGDVFGTDPYPLGGGPIPDDVVYGEADLNDRRHMPRTYGWTVDTVHAVKGSRPVWQVLQLFRYGGKFPTYEEMRQQAWKAIIGGADGILWWGFVHSVGMEAEWYERNNQQAYYDFKRISKEVMALEELLLSPNVEGIVSVNNPNVAYIVKKMSRSHYIVMSTNNTEVIQQGVTFTVNGTIRRVRLYAEPGNDEISVGTTSFTHDFGPNDVHVYILQLR